MNDQFINEKADEYGINPNNFATKDSFVRAVEHAWDQEVKQFAQKELERVKAEAALKSHLNSVDWEHDFGYDRKCARCGISLLDYHAKHTRNVPDDLCPGKSE